MTASKFPLFRVICPKCNLQQTGYVKQDENGFYWQCVNKLHCAHWLNEDEFAALTNQSITTLKDL